MYPDFLCIGAQKAGTTWLQSNLALHPEIELPPLKELHYFDHRPPLLFERLFGRKNHLRKARSHLARTVVDHLVGRRREDLGWALRYALAPRDDRWYGKLFPEIDGKIQGEVCPGYARIEPEGVEKIATLMPRAKIIYLLRNPVERAWSSLAMHFRKDGNGRVEDVSEDEVLRRFLKPKTYRHGRYAMNLTNWRRHFSEDQLMVGFFEDLRDDPRAFLRSVLDFLGVSADDSTISESVGIRRNPGRFERMPGSVEKALAQGCLAEVEAIQELIPNDHTARWLEETRRRI